MGTSVNEDTKSVFTRKLWTHALESRDFKSKWEMGKKPSVNKQKEICIAKGVSVHKYENENDIIEFYSKIHKNVLKFKRKAKLGKYFCKFQFKKGAGKIWKTGINKPRHFTFFKSDDFNIKLLDVLKIMEF
ncbi:hypothetical protein ACFL7M_13655 [Thermodesulfobacteriota bacterium]